AAVSYRAHAQRCYPSDAEAARIRARSKKLALRRDAATGLQHLRSEEREQLSVLRNGVSLVPVGSEHRADEIAAELHAAMPWLGAATEEVWHALRRSAQADDPGARIPPLLLAGPPGIGKSIWARRLGDLIGVPSIAIDASGETAGFAVAGSQRGWASSQPGRTVETIRRTLVGNPVIIVDEIEKAGRVTSDKGHSHNIADALLPLLEPATARRWSCPAYRVTFDMSWISWILISNSTAPLPEPLLSRCRIVRLGSPGPEHLIQFAWQEGRRRDLSELSIGAIEESIRRLIYVEEKISLRTVIRQLERAAFLEAKPMVH
uniref:AAA family ATPase n=1 Tax=Acidimangrovimonas sediminis TaxID=2056283 RepID=UPI0011AF17A0